MTRNRPFYLFDDDMRPDERLNPFFWVIVLPIVLAICATLMVVGFWLDTADVSVPEDWQ